MSLKLAVGSIHSQLHNRWFPACLALPFHVSVTIIFAATRESIKDRVAVSISIGLARGKKERMLPSIGEQSEKLVSQASSVY